MKKKYFIGLIALLCIALLIGLACNKSSSSYPNPSGGGNNTATGDISMYNMTFTPASKTVKVGAVVKWNNNDGYAHTVTSNDGSTFDSGTINGGGTYSYITTKTGTFEYHCTIHGVAMSGTLVVTP